MGKLGFYALFECAFILGWEALLSRRGGHQSHHHLLARAERGFVMFVMRFRECVFLYDWFSGASVDNHTLVYAALVLLCSPGYDSWEIHGRVLWREGSIHLDVSLILFLIAASRFLPSSNIEPNWHLILGFDFAGAGGRETVFLHDHEVLVLENLLDGGAILRINAKNAPN